MMAADTNTDADITDMNADAYSGAGCAGAQKGNRKNGSK